MFCPKCGYEYTEGKKFCAMCGEKFQVVESTNDSISVNEATKIYESVQTYGSTQSYGSAPTYVSAPAYGSDQAHESAPTSGAAPSYESELSYGSAPTYQGTSAAKKDNLRWAKFLGYFALWLGAVANFGTAMSLFTGLQYNGLVEKVYSVFPTLKGLDTIYGIVCMVIVVLGIICALSIIKRKKRTVILVPLLHGTVMCSELIYCALGTAIIGSSCFDVSVISNICINAGMLFINYTYFKHRAHIFVN